ncbi:IclR family transcriptional regulator [Pukyongiella litopenaei]|uniref:IclR family transcriptional regulator n=1 Tax=Pukyongiella litopenaei TaxID=2605946 RepID=A0A2S0MUU5_9RHOB|nr:IclR family transcriptional regulator [Pukyongiella litopenaei]AVO39648.1 IclR family transcriptional regulator [Pukyongiella litopenaei]
MFRNTTRSEPGKRIPTAEDRAEPLFVQSVERAMAVLSAFHHADGPLTLTEITTHAGLDRSATQRMVHTLRALNYIRRDAGGHGFVPGVRILDHTLDYLRLHPLVRQATPVLQELRTSVRERVDLSLVDDTRMIYAVRLQTKRQTFNASLLGHSVPAFCTSGGWAMLSRLPEADARDIIERSDRRPFTPHTLTDPDEIMQAVGETRRNGYALALNQLLSGEIALGFPVLDNHGRPVAAIHIAGSLSEWTPGDYVARFAPLGQQTARALSKY